MSFTVEGRVAFSSSPPLEPPVSRRLCMQALLRAFLCSMGNGGGGDAAGSLLLFPVLSELSSPLRWWAGAAGLQTCSSLCLCQQQSEIAGLPLPPHSDRGAVKGNRRMSYSNGFSRWQGEKNSYFHQHPPVSTRVPCPACSSGLASPHFPTAPLSRGKLDGAY